MGLPRTTEASTMLDSLLSLRALTLVDGDESDRSSGNGAVQGSTTFPIKSSEASVKRITWSERNPVRGRKRQESPVSLSMVLPGELFPNLVGMEVENNIVMSY
ncbi:hypothetical protein ACJJTC_011735 [Scirpophaga incertulas]